MQDVLQNKSKGCQDGDALEALESIGINWLQRRQAVVKSYGKNSIKLSELFSINLLNDREILLSAYSSYLYDDDEIILPPLYKDNEDFIMRIG